MSVLCVRTHVLLHRFYIRGCSSGPSTFNVNVVGSLDCTITDEGVIHQITIKVNAVDEDVKVRDAGLRIKVKTGEYLCPVQIELAFSFLLAILGLDTPLELIEEL